MSETHQSTKERILLAASQIFGEKGFKGATIRRIAGQARVNVAAIHYHFGDKEALYRSVLDDAFRQGFTDFPAFPEGRQDQSPEIRLRTFIRAMFARLLSSKGWGGMAGKGRLIGSELLNPSHNIEPILDRYIRPHKDQLLLLIADILGEQKDRDLLTPCALAIIGQCIYYALAARFIEKIAPAYAPHDDNLEQLADFVWQFSLRGIVGFQGKNDNNKDAP